MPRFNFNASPARSALMSRVRRKDTQPEMLVRRELHRLGYRYRLHVRDLPGCPDIVLPKHRTIIQVKGCFWHGHQCGNVRIPKRNLDYWIPKLERNRSRDASTERKLRVLGWSVHSIWGCRLTAGRLSKLSQALVKLIEGKGSGRASRHV